MDISLNSKYKSGIIHLNVSYLIEAQIIFVLFERLFVYFGIPGSIIYILDICDIILFLIMLNKKNIYNFAGILVSYSFIVIFSIMVALVNYSEWNGNFLFTLIDVRNLIRFIVFFLACISFLNKESYERIYKILILFFFINAIVIIYQYFTFHPLGTWTRGDLLNGLFGTTVGGNTFVNVVMLISVTYLLCKWSDGKISFILFISSALISLLIAGLIELKAYFVEFLILYIWYFLKKKKSKKEKMINIIIIILFLFFAYFVLQIMYREYPWFREVMTLPGMLKYLNGNGYTGTGDLNRFTGIFSISRRFFNGDIINTLFGIGLGNGSAFSLSGTETIFYSLYKDSHYNWFSATYIFVQCGAIGLLMYLYTFINLLMRRKEKGFLKLNSQIICIIALFLVFYGEALKTDAGYIVYFAIASGFVRKNDYLTYVCK